jgi:hypothetical protein
MSLAIVIGTLHQAPQRFSERLREKHGFRDGCIVGEITSASEGWAEGGAHANFDEASAVILPQW